MNNFENSSKFKMAVENLAPLHNTSNENGITIRRLVHKTAMLYENTRLAELQAAEKKSGGYTSQKFVEKDYEVFRQKSFATFKNELYKIQEISKDANIKLFAQKYLGKNWQAEIAFEQLLSII